MRIYPIRLFPDPVLRKKAASADWNARQTQDFIKNLVTTLSAQPSGVGIAAPQVGVSERVIIVDVSSKDPAKTLEIMMNPKILRLEGEILSREGCMSLPDYTANVKRATRVQIEWVDKDGHLRRKTTEGIEAICLQHEIDHLNGLLFIDRVASLKTEVFVRKKRAR